MKVFTHLSALFKPKANTKGLVPEHLRARRFGTGIQLPLTGDFVDPKTVDAIQIEGNRVLVHLTSGRELVIDATSVTDARIIRKSIVHTADLVSSSGWY